MIRNDNFKYRVICFTVNMEKFTGLNIHGFRPIKIFAGILSRCHGQHVYYLTIAKYSQENFRSTLKNRESLAQQIFPRLRYTIGIHQLRNTG